MPKKGYKQTKEHRRKSSLAKMGERNGMYGVHRFGKDNPMFGKKRKPTSGCFEKGYIPWNKNLTAKDDNRILSGEQNGMFGICRYGKNNPNYGNGDKIRGDKNPMYKNPRKDLQIKFKGEGNPAWQNGISFEPYGIEFNNNLKELIRQRDEFTCQFCGTVQNGRKFPSHHIDYDKKNNSLSNLILLCISCNFKANSQRLKWQFLFEVLQEIRRS